MYNRSEIYQNQTDFTTHGTLMSILDHTSTKFGARLLKNWIGKPLTNKLYVLPGTLQLQRLPLFDQDPEPENRCCGGNQVQQVTTTSGTLPYLEKTP